MDWHRYNERLRQLIVTGKDVSAKGVPSDELDRVEGDLTSESVYAFAAVNSMTQQEVDLLVAEIDLDDLLGDLFTESRNEGARIALIIGLSQRAAPAVAAQLQRSALRDHGVRESTTRWWSVVSQFRFVMPAELHGAVCWAGGDTLARLDPPRAFDEKRLLSTLRTHACEHSPGITAGRLLADLRTRAYDDITGITGVKVALRELIDQEREALIPLMPWLLASAHRDEISFLADLVISVPAAFRRLKELSEDPQTPAHTRTRGLTRILSLSIGGEEGDLSRWASDNSTFLIPTRLSAPSSVWTDDATLENAIRSAVDAATEDLRTSSLAKEDLITGALVTLLRVRLESLVGRSSTRPDHRGLDLTSVTTPSTGKGGEKINGADLAILLTVDVPDELNAERAHLVQVKRPPVTKRDSTPPRWSIDTEQLENILEHDPTATYWLVTEIPTRRILCVPASYLEARAKARPIGRYGQKGDLLALGYDPSLSSAAIPLGQLLVDLVIGMWVGSTSQKAIAVAKGTKTKYRPEVLLHLRIGVAEERG